MANNSFPSICLRSEKNTIFGKHKINSQCQCNKCVANPVPLPHMQECIQHAATVKSDELSFGVAEGFDVNLPLTPPPPPAVVSDVTSLECFRRHQELNLVPIIPR
jgi:hypothetical protein